MSDVHRDWSSMTGKSRIDYLIAHHPKRKHGVMHLRKGPMFAEKSTWLALKGHSALHKNKRVSILRFNVDTRDKGSQGVVTHNGDKFLSGPNVTYYVWDAVPSEAHPDEDSWDVVLIEEAQFWPQELAGYCKRLWLAGKEVYIAGLSGDLNQKSWPTVDAIVPLCDKVEDVCAECKVCGGPAPFTICTEQFDGSVHPGTDGYHAVCGTCRNRWANGPGVWAQ